jgi:hypothetical protein
LFAEDRAAQVTTTDRGVKMPNVSPDTSPFMNVICVSTNATPLVQVARTSIGVAGTSPKIQVGVHGFSTFCVPAASPVCTT